jgi:hypothetical protein
VSSQERSFAAADASAPAGVRRRHRSLATRSLVALGAIALLVVGCSPVSRPQGAPGRTVQVPASIDATGTHDVTGPLQQFLSSTPSGTTIVFPRGARYRIEGTIYLRRRNNMVIEGSGATLFATTLGDRTRSHWLVRDSVNMRFRGLTIVGSAKSAGMGDEAYEPSLEAQHAFQLEGVRQFELDSVTASDVQGDFVNIARDPHSKAWSDGVWIHDSNFARNGRMGISITSGRNIVIERNRITDTRRSTIDLEPNTSSGGAEFVKIDRNWIGPGRLNFVSAGKTASTRSNDVHDVMISNNTLDGHILNVFVATRTSTGQRRSNIAVVNNTSNKPAHGVAPLRFTYIDGVTVRGNRQPTKLVPVETNYCTRVNIAGNAFAL